MSDAHRRLGCSVADGRSAKKVRRTMECELPAFPRGIRATGSLNISSLDSTLLTSTPPEEISPNLWTCPICLGIPRVPAQISSCGHIGCMSCLLQHLHVSGNTRNGWEQRLVTTCPLCRADFSEDKLNVFSSWHPLSKAVLGLVKTRCSLGASSTNVKCSWSGPVMDLLHHESYDCPVREIVCPNPFCAYINSESKVQQHFSTCNCLQVRCMECCLPMRWETRDTHSCEQALMEALRGKCLI